DTLADMKWIVDGDGADGRVRQACPQPVAFATERLQVAGKYDIAEAVGLGRPFGKAGARGDDVRQEFWQAVVIEVFELQGVRGGGVMVAVIFIPQRQMC